MKDLSIGRRLAIAREDAELTQDQLASKLGVSRDTLSSWENSDATNRYPPADILKRLCEETGVTADWILWGESRVILTGKPRIAA
jgi:transcriptional regulator with XRE-family HTH domain